MKMAYVELHIPPHLIHISLLVEGKGEREDIVLLVVGTTIVKDTLGGNSLPKDKKIVTKMLS